MLHYCPVAGSLQVDCYRWQDNRVYINAEQYFEGVPEMETLSYRPRNAGHDYYGRGTYLITLVVSGREQLLSHFVADLGRKAEDGHEAPAPLALTPLGEAVQEAWLQTPAHAQTHGNKVVVHACVCMPDHFHGVIEVLEPMQWSLGDIIQAFKATCTSSWPRQ